MGIVTLLTAAVTPSWPAATGRAAGRAYVAAVLFPVGVALTGAIIVNRYDAAVALLIAIFILCLWARWLTAAAFVLGMGFALKFTPAALCPWCCSSPGTRAAGRGRWWPSRPRRWRRSCRTCSRRRAASGTSSSTTSSGRCRSRACWARRCCSASSSASDQATLGHGATARTCLVARGAGLAATASGGLTLLAVAGVYLLIWRRRERLRAAAPDQALAVLALILALMTFGKVLSPQYFIWTLPAWALVAARDRALAILGGLHPAAHPGRVPGALLAVPRHAAGVGGDRGHAQHAAGRVLCGGGLAVVGVA